MLLEVKHIEKSFEKGVPVVQKTTFDVNENEIVALLGPSGCGKTTTLRIISGFERLDAGEVFFGWSTVIIKRFSSSATKKRYWIRVSGLCTLSTYDSTG